MLQLRNVCKTYVTGDLTQVALDHVSLDFRDNEFVAVLGPSGSGKTTLLNIVGGLDRYDEGDLIIDGVTTKEYTDKDWDSYRNHTIGFVFQNYNLIPHQSILSNVELALTISNVSKSERRQRAMDALAKVGLAEQAHKKPNQMSGGQMQRVAIARALVNDPSVILADEPTGALDSKTSLQVMDLLKEVAKDRLVIMVTHNPDLADKYANRVINIMDGRIVSDSNPVPGSATDTTTHRTPKTKLGFLTALALSKNNLLTKKGRTFLTAFAGSIGIIGIALILALSNGMNNYISSVEHDMLGSYPISLERQAIDLEGFMSIQEDSGESPEDMFSNADEEASGKEESGKSKDEQIHSNNIVADTVKTSQEFVKTNDLSAFKKYLDENYEKLGDSVSAIEYTYDLTPQVYRKDKKNGLVHVSPASLSTSTTLSGDTDSGGGMFSGSMSDFMAQSVRTQWRELISNQDLREQQYELVKGKWPKKFDEVVLVINEDNEVSDYTLYALGLLDISDMNHLLELAENGKKFEDPTHSIDFDEVLGRTYQVLAPSQLYSKSGSVYADQSGSDEFIEKQLANAVTVKITGILRAKDDAEIYSGIGYPAELTYKLMDVTAETDVVKAQLKNKKINVLTGKEFGEDTGYFSSGLSILGLSSAGEVSAETADVTAGPEGNTAVRPSFLGGTQTAELPRMAAGNKVKLPGKGTFKVPDITDPVQFFMTLSGNAIRTLIAQILGVIPKEAKAQLLLFALSLVPQEDLEMLMEQFIGSLSEEDLMKLMGVSSGSLEELLTSEGMQQFIESYIANLSEEDIQKIVQSVAGSMSEQELQALMQEAFGNISQDDLRRMIEQQLGSLTPEQIQELFGDSLQDLLGSGALGDILNQLSGSTPNTYESVMEALGYYTRNDPSGISIYPSDFDGKAVVQDFIKAYNDQVKDEKEKVTYTDLISTVTGSIQKVVNIISYVLIAFVAISLVVSSIMIAIITYISVLERTKEIGVLRAIGASKNDISKIFNAETFIEGLIAGAIGVLVTRLLCIPINAIVESRYNVVNIASLPLHYALLLILISVFLTFIAGFIPARIAAKKDPVEALRTE